MLAAMPSAAGGSVATYTIQTDKPRQTVLHFGASDAWSMKYVGRWPEAEQRKVADWLFSTDCDDAGKPKGIGLSLWRFNIGAGSEEQGEASMIQPSTRTECMVGPDGKFNPAKQQAERHFLRLARERGVPHILAFLNSPPVYLTQNKLATNTGRGGTLNLGSDRYDDFAAFVTTAIEGLERYDSVTVDYISPLNEPDGHWNWLGPKQEGTPATNREVARVVRCLDNRLGKAGLQTKILVNESSDLRCLLGTHMTDWQRANELRALFSKDSTDTYVGRCRSVLPVIAGHSYWTNTPTDTMRNIRMRLRDAARRLGVDYWQTELCIMSNDVEIGGGGGYDFSMKTALYVATVARTYRKAIDDCLKSEELYKSHMDWYREQIAACTYREFTTGFFYGRPDETAQIYDSNTYRKGYTYLGMVNGVAEDGCIETEQRNKFSVGERIEIMKPDGSNPEAEVLEIRDMDGTPMESAPHPQQKLLVKLSCQAERYDILRRREQENG